MKRSRKNRTPKEVVRAIDILSQYIESAKSTDQAAVNVALAATREECAALSALFKNAEMRFTTGQVHKPKKLTFAQALGVVKK